MYEILKFQRTTQNDANGNLDSYHSTLKQLLDEARAIELAHTCAVDMEQREFHAFSSYCRNRNNESNKRYTHTKTTPSSTLVPDTHDGIVAMLPRDPTTWETN